MARTNQNIQQDIRKQLIFDQRVNAAAIEIIVKDGTVELTGHVPTYSTKRAARESTWGVPGVLEIVDNLTVTYPPSLTVPNDQQIKMNVENIIIWNSDLDAGQIDISVQDGIVTLEGTVDQLWLKPHAEKIASQVTGVTDIINKLTVVPTNSIADQDIAQQVIDALQRRLPTSIDHINIKVKNGKVTLTGTVSSYADWRTAYDTAEYASGAVEVNDRLQLPSL